MDADFLLIRKMKQGDDSAIDAFVCRYYNEVLKYCSYHCPDKNDAEDLTQETFVHFFAKLPGYHYKGKNKNYLYTIAGNLCKDYFKKKRDLPVEEIQLSEKIGPQEPRTENNIEHLLDKMIIEQALGQLPEELKEVVILYYFQGLKLTDIADALQIGLPLVKYRLRQAKKQLERLLRKEDIYGSGRTTYVI